MERKVILINEDIFTEDIKVLSIQLEKSLDVLNNLRNGIKSTEFEKCLEEIKDVKEALSYLSDKKFNDVKTKTVFIDN